MVAEMSTGQPSPSPSSLPSASSRWWVAALIVVQVCLWSVVMLWEPPPSDDPLNVAVRVWPGSETFFVARERGWLDTQSIQLVEMTWPSAALRAFANRVVDGAVLSLDDVLRLRQDGLDVKVLAVLDVSRGGDALVARPGITSTEMLRGKKVGVELRTSMVHLLGRVLEKSGMTLGDVTQVPLNLAESEDVLKTGDVDAVLTALPWQVRLTEAGAVVLGDSRETGTEFLRLIVVHADALKTRREALRRLLAAHYRVLPDMTEKLSGTEKTVISRREGLRWEGVETAEKRLHRFDHQETLDMMRGTPSRLDEVAAGVADYLVKIGQLSGRPDLKGWVDASLIEEVAR